MPTHPFPSRERALHQVERQIAEQPATDYEPQPLHPVPAPEQRTVRRLQPTE